VAPQQLTQYLQTDTATGALDQGVQCRAPPAFGLAPIRLRPDAPGVPTPF
jgi:hypothetical protein